MGRSVQSTEALALKPASFYHRLSNRHYSIRSDSMRRHQVDADGREIQIIEKPISFGIGSGNHAVTLVNRTPRGLLIELPVSWYRQQGTYAMSPGYDSPDHIVMRREISSACLFGHAEYPKSGAATISSIDCERCHGETKTHLANPRRGTILNPARLAPERQLDVCLQCHLQTVSRGISDAIRRPGRGPFSFRPGEALSAFKMFFDRTDPPEPRFEVNHAGYRLMQSKCFQSSGGKMTCTTCHDAHSFQARAACQGCHDSAHAKAANTDCAGCHMAKRRPADAIHVTMTDHWIQRRPAFENPVRESHETYSRRVVPYYGGADPLSLTIANIRGLTEDVPDLYRAQLQREPNDVPTLAALGNALFRLGRESEAIPFLQKALRLDPNHVGTLNTLAVARAAAGQRQEAIALLDRARLMNPDHSLTWVNLGVTYNAMGEPEKAIVAFWEAIRLQPDFAEARAKLAAVLAQGTP